MVLMAAAVVGVSAWGLAESITATNDLVCVCGWVGVWVGRHGKLCLHTHQFFVHLSGWQAARVCHACCRLHLACSALPAPTADLRLLADCGRSVRPGEEAAARQHTKTGGGQSQSTE